MLFKIFLKGMLLSENVAVICSLMPSCDMPIKLTLNLSDMFEKLELNPFVNAFSNPNQLFKRFVTGLTSMSDIKKLIVLLNIESTEKTKPFQIPIEMKIAIVIIIAMSIQFITLLISNICL